jgi:hypothetical protein
MKDAKKMIETEFERRMKLVEDESFRTKAIEVCKAVGISPSEWNQNKGLICLYIANMVCKLENEMNK